MKRLKIGARAFGIAVMLAGAAGAQPRPSVITNADWLRKPSGQDMARYYPQAATMLNFEGSVVLHCQVAVSGRLEACDVRDESPKGLGFGKAALELGRIFLMRPQTRDGTPASGGQVNIPIAFRLPVTQPPHDPPPATPKSPGALAAAQRFLAAAKQTDSAARSYEQAATAFDVGVVLDVSAENSAIIARAIRAAYPARLQELTDSQARLYASRFSERELTALESFTKTKASSVIFDTAEAAQARAAKQAPQNRLRQAAVSREIFCASRRCTPDAPDEPAAPRWTHIPTMDQVRLSEPALARIFNLPTVARLTCTVMAQGSLGGCQVTDEFPKGLGVGGAALTLTGSYSLDLTGAKSIEIGQPVGFEVRFDALPEEFVGPEISAVAPRSPASLALARELLSFTNPPISNPTAMQRQWSAAQPLPPGVTRADQMAAFDVMDQAFLRVHSEMIDERASWLTTQLTDEELLAALKIWRGALGAAWRAHIEDLTRIAQQAAYDANVRIWADVHQAFCAAQTCYTPPPRAPMPASSAPSTRTP